MNGGKDGSELHVGHRWNESLNVLNGKGASDFLSEKFDAQIRRYYFWRSCLVYLDSEKQALVVERGGVVDHEIKISDVLRVLKDPRGLVVQDRHMKEVVFRVNDEAIQNSFFVALRALVGEAHEAAMINSRFAVAEQMFRDADTDTNGKLDVQEVTQLLSKLQFEMPPEQVAVLCNRGDAELDRSALALNMKATVTSKEFLDIFSRVMHRKEVLTSVFYVYAGDNNVMNHRELIEFLVEEQKEGRDAAKAAARTIIEKYSTTKTSKASTLDVNGFMDFLQGGDNQAWDPCHAHIFMDMTQPLCNYFIASSHNTYLAGNQLTGAASAEAYSKSLQDGARCVEVDLWEDEDGEPTITHGHTLTGEIKFRDVLDVVGKETISFAKSSFPLIISMEDHLTRASRLRLVQIMKENRGFWSMLYRPDPKMSLKDRMKLSPMDLKNKILIKMKVKKETPPELAELILIRGAKLKGSWEDAMALPPLSCVSHDESRVQQFCEEGEGPQLIEFNHAHLTRVYPAGKRVDSSNFDPTPAWLVRPPSSSLLPPFIPNTNFVLHSTFHSSFSTDRFPFFRFLFHSMDASSSR